MNFYYSEVDGLARVGEIEWSDEPYEFDITAVWRGGDGKLYWASDSGCSCPEPFEAFNKVEDLETGSREELQEYLEARGGGMTPEIADLMGSVVR